MARQVGYGRVGYGEVRSGLVWQVRWGGVRSGRVWCGVAGKVW